MRTSPLFPVSALIVSLATVAIGCSSAPPGETTGETDQALNLGGGGIGVNYCAALPALQTSLRQTTIPGLADPVTVRDCYHHVVGFEVAVPARVTTCRALYLPGVGYWYDASGSPGPSWSQEVPQWGGHAGGRVCHYAFSGLYDLSWQTSYAQGNDQATEESLATGLCAALESTGTPYSGVRYILPAVPSDVPGGPANDMVIGPNGFPIPDYGNSFELTYCYGIVGGCGSCVR